MFNEEKLELVSVHFYTKSAVQNRFVQLVTCKEKFVQLSMLIFVSG